MGRCPTERDAVTNYQLVAIGTSRDRTLQAGKLLLIDLNGSEAHVARSPT